MCSWSRHDPAENLHFRRVEHRHLRHLWSDEERRDEETKHEAETWTVQLTISGD